MTTTASPASSARAFALPNLLTYARIVAVPVVVGCMYFQSILGYGLWLRWVALVDLHRGRHHRRARRLRGAHIRAAVQFRPHARSDRRQAAGLVLPADARGRRAPSSGPALWAAIIILCREILVSGLREYLAELRVTVQVTWLAKWKTFLQLLAVGFCIAGEAGDKILPITTEIGIGLLWFSAMLTLYTGWDYFRAGVRHLIDD